VRETATREIKVLISFSICGATRGWGQEEWGHDCKWGAETCSAAAAGGHFEMLKWLREQGCPWSMRGDTCASAAAGGHLEILKWLREHGYEVE